MMKKEKIYHENRCGLCDLVSGNYYVFPSFTLLVGKNELFFEEVN